MSTGEELTPSMALPPAAGEQGLAVDTPAVLDPQRPWLMFVAVAASMNAAILACDSPFEGFCALTASLCLVCCVYAWLSRAAADASSVLALRHELERAHAAAQSERARAQLELARAHQCILEVAQERDSRGADLATVAEERGQLEVKMADRCAGAWTERRLA